MSFLKSLLNNSKKFNDPFTHWELNQPLTDTAIQEISNADISNPKDHNLQYDGTRAIDGGEGKFREGIASGGQALKFRCFINKKNLQLVVISSMRTPSETIKLAKEYFGSDHLIIDNVDKKAYLSALSLAKFIVVMCDSSSMISEAALTGKPIYVAQIPSSKNDYRFKKFRDLFKELNIIKELNDNLETWNYERLDETNRVAQEIKKKLI